MSVQFWILWLLGLVVSTLVGAFVVRRFRQYGLMVLGGFLAIYVVGANILVPRLVSVEFFGIGFVLVTGSIIWPYTAQISDMLNEIYGRKAAYLAAAVSYLANLMFVSFVLMAFQTTAIWEAPQEAWFTQFFGVAWRVTLASICSYSLANWADITLFSKIKKWAMNKENTALNLLLFSTARSAGSDVLNMVIDNIVFYSIAFLGTMPFDVLLGIIGSSMLAKIILSQIDLPFYWVFRLLTRGVQRDL